VEQVIDFVDERIVGHRMLNTLWVGTQDFRGLQEQVICAFVGKSGVLKGTCSKVEVLDQQPRTVRTSRICPISSRTNCHDADAHQMSGDLLTAHWSQ
jgi:hypothetical protein